MKIIQKHVFPIGFLWISKDLLIDPQDALRCVTSNIQTCEEYYSPLDQVVGDE